MAAKSNIYLEWDIHYESIKTKKQRNKIITGLLDGIASKIKQGESIPLKYEIFKSETDKLLYVLRVYKLDESTAAVKPAAAAKAVRAKSLSIIDTDSGAPSADFSGPTRPSGPPSQMPPGVFALTAQ